MSTGGVFTLISNTGIQDQLLFQTDYLSRRLADIRAKRLEELKTKYPNKSAAELKKDDYYIPNLIDIEKTHTLFVSSTFKPFVAISHEYSKTPPCGGIPTLGGTFSFVLPIIGEFVNDAVVYIKLTNLSARSALDKVRYVEMLGHRLMKQVSFKVQNQLFDSYNSDVQNAYYAFKVPLQKENGYLRNIGQEVPHTGYLTADPTVDEVREYRYFGDGPQTFKQTQADIEMWIPILFWFKDIKTALPNFILPQNQVEIEIQLEQESNLIAFADYGGGGLYNVPRVESCYLYINHIFLLPEINQIFMNKFGFQLIRVHRIHTEILNVSEKNVHLHQLKWPVECLYVGFRPRTNLTNSQRWYKNTHITAVNVKEAVVTGVATIQVNNAVYLDERPVVADMEVLAHDNVLYPLLASEFYGNYLPYRYGDSLKTPKDLGWHMINFNMNPGEYNPNGHLNVSRSRELHLHYQSALHPSTNLPLISLSNPTDLIVIADAINFVLYEGGNIVLKFST